MHTYPQYFVTLLRYVVNWSPWLQSLCTIFRYPSNSPETWLSESFLLCIIISFSFTSQTTKLTLMYLFCPFTGHCSFWLWSEPVESLIFIRALGQSLQTGSKYDEYRNKLQMLRAAWRPLIIKRETLKVFSSVWFLCLSSRQHYSTFLNLQKLQMPQKFMDPQQNPSEGTGRLCTSTGVSW